MHTSRLGQAEKAWRRTAASLLPRVPCRHVVLGRVAGYVVDLMLYAGSGMPSSNTVL